MTGAMNNIPLVDLKAQYFSIKGEIDAAIQEVINKTDFIGGSALKKFEADFAAAIGVKNCIGVGNGTDALYVALRALGVGKGDEVLVPANTFIATSEAVTLTGAKVVFVDVDEKTYNISPKLAMEKITPATKAIMAVHLYGNPADISALRAFADSRGIFIVEDAAQAHLAKIDGRYIGSLGHAACFSFYPGKNLGAYGDAGAVVTNDDALGKKIRMLANHGRMDKYNHEIEGINSRLDGLQAAILGTKLKHLADWTAARRRIAQTYGKLLDRKLFTLPEETPGNEHVYHLYVIRFKARDALLNALKEKGIGAGVHYPIPLPRLKAYEYLNHKAGDFPVSERLSMEILSLPIYPELSDETVAHIARQCNEAGAKLA